MEVNAISYTVKPDSVEKNQQLVENVFSELHRVKPTGFAYIVLRLADGTFLHMFRQEDTSDFSIEDLAAFHEFQEGAESRRRGSIEREKAMIIGAYNIEGSKLQL